MNNRPNIHMELGRVVFSNPDKYTLDIISESGRFLQGVPFLSAYSKPAGEGQGVYMLPEQNSYTMVVRILSGKSNFFEREVFCFGFFNPTDEKGGFKGGREQLSPGDFCFKTVAGNKIIGSTDGVLLFYATDLCQIQLFPFSGNVKDGAGLDNLIRMFMENLELHTDGGFWNWKVSKKENKTNFSYLFKNKPLNENEPDILRGDIGSQGLMGDDSYFHTFEQLTTKAKGAEEVLKVSQKEKINGHTERILYNDSGEKEYELLFRADGSKEETQFQGGSQVWKATRNPDGTSKLMIGSGSEFEITISPSGKISMKTDDDMEILVRGEVNQTIEKDYTENVEGDVLKTAEGSVVATAPDIHLDSADIKLGETNHKGVVNETGRNAYQSHTHEVNFDLTVDIDPESPNAGKVQGTITVAPPNSFPMPVSTTVKASD